MHVSGDKPKDLLPRPILIDRIYEQLGGVEQCEKRTGIKASTLRTWEQSPNDSGREPTLLGVIKIMALTASQPLNATLRGLAREFLMHFAAPANLRISTDDPLQEIRFALDLLEQRAGLPPAIKPYHCPECGRQLVIEAFVSGVPVFGKCGEHR